MKCDRCNGQGFSVIAKWKCPVCDGKGVVEPLTEQEYLQTCNTEQLAECSCMMCSLVVILAHLQVLGLYNNDDCG